MCTTRHCDSDARCRIVRPALSSLECAQPMLKRAQLRPGQPVYWYLPDPGDRRGSVAGSHTDTAGQLLIPPWRGPTTKDSWPSWWSSQGLSTPCPPSKPPLHRVLCFGNRLCRVRFVIDRVSLGSFAASVNHNAERQCGYDSRGWRALAVKGEGVDSAYPSCFPGISPKRFTIAFWNILTKLSLTDCL